jgi:hypothetical protein
MSYSFQNPNLGSEYSGYTQELLYEIWYAIKDGAFASPSDIVPIIDQYVIDHPELITTEQDILELARKFYFSLSARVDISRQIDTGDLSDNFKEFTVSNMESCRSVSDSYGFIYYFATDGSTVYVYDTYRDLIVNTISTGQTLNLVRGIFNPKYNKIYFYERYTGDLISFSLSDYTFTTYARESTDLQSSGEFVGYPVHNGDFSKIYEVAYTGLEVLVWDLDKVENGLSGTDYSFLLNKVDTGNQQSTDNCYMQGALSRNGCLYFSPVFGSNILKIDPNNSDSVSYIPLVSGSFVNFGLSSNRAYTHFCITNDNRRYILIYQMNNGLQNGGNYMRIDTDSDTIDYRGFPNLLNHVPSTFGAIGNATVGTDNRIYIPPSLENINNDRFYVYDLDNDSMTEIDNASENRLLNLVSAANGFMYSQVFKGTYTKIQRVQPTAPKEIDSKRTTIIR